MDSLTNLQEYGSRETVLPSDYLDARWYAAYTFANHERKVRNQLEQRDIEVLLPVYEAVRRWKDRQKHLELPLFPGYIFVHLPLRDRLQVLKIPGVVGLVGFGGRPAAIRDQEIEALQDGIGRKIRLAPCPYLKVGRRVRVKSGPLQGLEGFLVRKKNSSRFVISLALIMRSVATEIDIAELEPIR